MNNTIDDIKGTFKLIKTYEIIKNNKNIIDRIDVILKNLSELDTTIYNVFDIFFNELNYGKIEEINRSRGDSYCDALKKYGYSEVREIILLNIDKPIKLAIDIENLINITNEYKRKFDNHEYEDTLQPPEPSGGEDPIEYTQYDQFWAYNSNEDNYINDVIIPSELIIREKNQQGNATVKGVLDWLYIGQEVLTRVGFIYQYIGYKYSNDKILDTPIYDVYENKLEYIKKYSNQICVNFNIAKIILEKNSDKPKYELYDLIIDEVVQQINFISSLNIIISNIKHFFDN